jgi:hypothetical protein
MSAAKAMVLAWFGLALNCVAVGNFAFCHEREATILAFGVALSGQHSAFSPENIFPPRRENLETRRKGVSGEIEEAKSLVKFLPIPLFLCFSTVSVGTTMLLRG